MLNYKNTNLYAILCALVSLLLGAVVIFGWHTGSIALIQVNENFAPMQYNTALGFLFSGGALCCLVAQRLVFARVMAVIVACFGVATLVQYVFEINLNIDQIFMDQTIMTKVSHPGRMAPNTALCFSLIGFALICASRNITIKRSVIISLAAATLVMSLIAFLGYLIPDDGIYGWANLTRMAIHTASGFLTLSTGLFCFALSKNKTTQTDLWEVMPVSVAASLIVITFFAWFIVHESSSARNKEYFDTLVFDVNSALVERYNLYEQSLWGGLGLFYASETITRDEWAAYVAALKPQKRLPGISGIGYIDYVPARDLDVYLQVTRADGAPNFVNHPDTAYSDKFIIKFIEPVEKNKAAVGLDIGFEKNRRAAAERARDLGLSALTEKITLVQDKKKTPGFLLLIPVYDVKETPSTLEARRAHIQGWVYAPFIGSSFMAGLTDVAANQLDLKVYDGDRAVSEALIYQSSDISGEALLQKSTEIQVAGRTWTILWASNDSFSPPSSLVLSLIVLYFGVFFSGLLYFTLVRLLHSKETIAREVEHRTQELADSESRQRAILHNTVDGILTINEAGIIQSFNPAAESIFGYKSAEIIGQNVSVITPIAHRGNHDGYVSRFVKTGKAKLMGTTSQLTAVRKNGEVFPVELSLSEVFLKDGRLFSGIIRDISEKLKNQERLDLLQKLLVSSGQAKDMDDFLEIVLKMICEYTNWPIGHAYIWSNEDGVLKPSCKWYMEDRKGYSEFRKVTEQTTFAPEIGLPGRVYSYAKPVWINDVAIDSNFPRNKLLTDINIHSGFGLPVFVNNEVRVVLEFFSPNIIEEDTEFLRLWETAGSQLSRVIERSEAQEKLKNALEFSDLITNNIPDLIFVKNSKFEIVEGNKAFLSVYPEDIRDRVIGTSSVENFNEEEADEFLRYDRLALENGYAETEETILFPDGKVRTLFTIKLRFYNAQNEAFILGIGRDITPLKEAEAERNMYLIETEMAKEEAMYANSMKSEFLANMSHEIRTPLNGVIGAGDLLKKTKISAEQKKYVDIIINSGDTLLALINDVLDLSKIEAGEVEINLEPVSIKRLIADLLSSFSPKALSKNIELKTNYIGEVPDFVSADPVRLSQILINLMGNAIKFVDRGHVAVYVEEINRLDEQVTLKISVEDTGIGIPADKLDMIFDKFAQADASTTKQYGGTGLGLAITQRLVSLMGGAISVKSEVGKGTTFGFEITVPVIEREEVIEGDVQQKSVSVGYGDEVERAPLNASVLLVDNELVNQLVATDMLEGMGCSVTLAKNGQEAVDMLAVDVDKYDVVLMDCMMPVMDGYEATQEIRVREEGSDRHQIIVAMTANAMADEREKCFEAGMDSYLSKPVKDQTLYDKLAEYLLKTTSDVP